MQKPKSPTPHTPAKTTGGTPGSMPATPAATPSTLAQRELAMNAIKDAYQKNFTALTQISQTLTTGAAAVFQRQQDLLRNSVSQAGAAAQERVAAVAPRQCPEAIDRYKQALDVSLANTRKIAELAEQSKREAFDTIHNRMNERFQERTQRSRGTFEPSPDASTPPDGRKEVK